MPFSLLPSATRSRQPVQPPKATAVRTGAGIVRAYASQLAFASGYAGAASLLLRIRRRRTLHRTRRHSHERTPRDAVSRRILPSAATKCAGRMSLAIRHNAAEHCRILPPILRRLSFINTAYVTQLPPRHPRQSISLPPNFFITPTILLRHVMVKRGW